GRVEHRETVGQRHLTLAGERADLVEDRGVARVALVIDALDRGPRQDVVELVEQDYLPATVERLGGIRGDAGLGGETGDPLQFAQGDFTPAVVALHQGLRG